MKGTLHLGDFHPALETAFAERLRALCPDGDARGVRLVVPNRLLGIHLRRRAAELGVGTVGLVPRALEDLASELAAPAISAGGWRTLPGFALPIVLEEVCGRRARRGYFKDIADLPGLYTALAGTFRDLRDGGVDAAAFAAAVGEHGRRGKLADLADLVRLAEEGLAARRLADMARTTELAIEALAARPADPAPLLVYGTYDLLPRQRRLIAALAAQAPVDVFFPWGEGRAFDYAAPLRAWFEEQGLVARRLEASEPGTRLAALRRGLFASVPTAALPADGSVRLLSAPHAEREAMAVLRALAIAPAPSALVLLRREGDAVSRLRGAARRAGLALHVAAESLADRPAGRAARLLVELVDQGAKQTARGAGETPRASLLPRTSIEDLLSTDALERGLFDEGSRPGRWAQILRRRGIVARRSDWETLVERYAGSGPQAVLPFIEAPEEEDRFLDPRLRRERPFLARWVQRLLTEIDRLAPTLRGGAGAWSRAAEAIVEMLGRWLAPGADRDAVQAAAATLAELDGAARVTPRRALTAFEQALVAGTRADGPRFGAAATVTTLAAARGVTAERVVVPGLVEGVFPRRAREDALLLDAERAAMQANLPAGAALPQQSRDSLAEERLLFRLAIGAARRELVLAWPRALDGGREVVPSAFVLDAARALLGRDLDYRGLYAAAAALGLEIVALGPTYPDDPKADLVASERALRRIEAVREGERPAADLGGLFVTWPRFRQALAGELSRRSTALGGYDGVVGRALGEAFLAGLGRGQGGVRLSASRLQSYARCGFRFFLESALGAQSEPAPERFLDLGAGDLGTLYHEVLHEVFRRLESERELPLDPRSLARAKAVLVEVLADESLFEDEAPEPLRRARRHRMREDLGGFLAAQAAAPGGWRPRTFEAEIGGGAPLIDAIGNRRLILAGRVDRIDAGPDGLRIVDYKTGKLGKDNFPEPPSLAGGRNLQLAYYARALAAERARAGEPAAEVHAAYLGVSTASGFREVAWEPRHFARAEAEFQRVVEGVVGGIERGEFFQVENLTFCTQQCDFRTLCGPGRARLIERKAGDARAVHAAEWRSGTAFPDAEDAE